MSAGAPSAGEDRSVCSACRGTGRVISGLGGTPHEVTCPWCGGDGVFKPGRNAQEGEKPSPPPGQVG
jgi:DnaJ-class molecular chaperone